MSISLFPQNIVDTTKRAAKGVRFLDTIGNTEGKPLEKPNGENTPAGRYDVYAGTPANAQKLEPLLVPGGTSLNDLVEYVFESRGVKHNSPVYSENIKETLKEIDIETNKLAADFYAGKVSTDDVKAKYKELFSKKFQSQYDNWQLSGNMAENKAEAEGFYTAFRYDIIANATNANYDEGMTYAVGIPSSMTYYNSDYYYKCEDFIAAISEAADELSNECGMGSFEVPDYSGVDRFSYNSFNTAMKNQTNSDVDIDLSNPPPRGFKLFHQNGRRDLPKRELVAGPWTSSDPNFVPFPTQPSPSSGPSVKQPLKFWVSLTQGDKTITKDASSAMAKNKYYSAAAYISFSEKDTPDFELLNQYLKNISIRHPGMPPQGQKSLERYA